MLAWESRITHFRQLMLSAQSIDLQRQEHGERKSGLLGLLALEFLTLLGVVEQTSQGPVLYEIPISVRRKLSQSFITASEQWDDPVTALYEAVIRTLFDYVPSRRGRQRGLPRVLIEEPAEALVAMLGLPSVIREAYEN